MIGSKKWLKEGFNIKWHFDMLEATHYLSILVKLPLKYGVWFSKYLQMKLAHFRRKWTWSKHMGHCNLTLMSLLLVYFKVYNWLSPLILIWLFGRGLFINFNLLMRNLYPYYLQGQNNRQKINIVHPCEEMIYQLLASSSLYVTTLKFHLHGILTLRTTSWNWLKSVEFLVHMAYQKILLHKC